MSIVSLLSSWVGAILPAYVDLTPPVIRLIEVVRDGSGKVYFRTLVTD